MFNMARNMLCIISSMLQIKNIKKEYKTGNLIQKALDDVSLNLRENEFVAILGPSGSGKTTLLNIIGGLDRYDSGDLIINGISTKNYKDRDWDSYRNHTIGFIFQSYNLIPHQTVLANVELALTISGISGEERKQRALDALEKVGLKGQEHKRPSQMSGGQMQRVAIARALVNDPDIVLADEPTGALDSETSVQVMDLLKEVAKDRLVVMVTHNPELAKEYATRIVVLKDGTIRSDSDPYVVEEVTEGIHQNMGKASMSLLTSLSLSFNNLRTKKARTFLVAFAGSIGIIGIALILSLSNGVNQYIKDTEEETLSEYPIEIQKDSVSLSSMMSMNPHTSSQIEDDGKVHEASMVSGMLSTVNSNDLKSLRTYLESDTCDINNYAKAIEYSYGITPQIYMMRNNDYLKLNPNDMFAPIGFSSSSSSIISSMMNLNIFFELPRSTSLYEDQYDLKAGHWPTKANECVLVLTSNGSVSDFLLYMVGKKDVNELEAYIDTFANNEEVEIKESNTEYNYDDFIGISFSVVSGADYYTYDETYGVYSNRSEDKSYMKELVKNGSDLHICGVVQPKENATISMLSMGIYYTQDLVESLREKASQSEVVQAQLKDQGKNVLTGKPFGEDSDPMDMNELFSIDENKIAKAFNIDTSKLTVDTSSFDQIDYSGAVSDDMTKNMMPDLSSDQYKDLFSNIHIQISEENLKKSFENILNDYLSYSSSNPSTDYNHLTDSLSAYFNSSEGQELLRTEIMKLLEKNKDNLLDTEVFTEAMQKVMVEYSKYLLESGKEMNEESFEEFLQTEKGQQVTLEAIQTVLDSIFKDLDFSTEDLQTMGMNILNGYIEYAKKNSLPDPSLFEESFSNYLKSSRGQELLQTSVKNSISNYDELEKELTKAYEKIASDIESSVADVMRQITTNIGSKITDAMKSSIEKIASSIPNAFYVDTNALASSFSMSIGEEELQSLMTSLMSSGSASLQKNLTSFGYAAEEDISEITIYPYDFESKEKITDILNDYNDEMTRLNKEEQVINYTDMVGTLMSSVTNIINTISYILIAFVAISLVVSSIMIGVITYISVLERKKEIGILRAMGASKANIAQVFNAETFITGLLAGVLGVGITVILLFPANILIHKIGNTESVNAYLQPTAALVLIGLSIVLTLIGGLIPSKKAAKSDPVAALRSE